MHRLSMRLGITGRKQADMKTALEITSFFRKIAPADPVRYDFALTRPGIQKNRDIENFLNRCLFGPPVQPPS
jgi:hypothetical protein